jgi:hypothetical protein
MIFCISLFIGSSNTYFRKSKPTVEGYQSQLEQSEGPSGSTAGTSLGQTNYSTLPHNESPHRWPNAFQGDRY